MEFICANETVVKKYNHALYFNCPLNNNEKNFTALFLDEVQLSQRYRATTRRRFTVYHCYIYLLFIPRCSWY